MANEVKRTAPDMDKIIAEAKKAGKLKTVLLTGRKCTIQTARWFPPAMLTRNLAGQRKNIRRSDSVPLSPRPQGE